MWICTVFNCFYKFTHQDAAWRQRSFLWDAGRFKKSRLYLSTHTYISKCNVIVKIWCSEIDAIIYLPSLCFWKWVMLCKYVEYVLCYVICYICKKECLFYWAKLKSMICKWTHIFTGLVNIYVCLCIYILPDCVVI